MFRDRKNGRYADALYILSHITLNGPTRFEKMAKEQDKLEKEKLAEEKNAVDKIHRRAVKENRKSFFCDAIKLVLEDAFVFKDTTLWSHLLSKSTKHSMLNWVVDNRQRVIPEQKCSGATDEIGLHMFQEFVDEIVRHSE